MLFRGNTKSYLCFILGQPVDRSEGRVQKNIRGLEGNKEPWEDKSYRHEKMTWKITLTRGKNFMI